MGKFPIKETCPNHLRALRTNLGYKPPSVVNRQPPRGTSSSWPSINLSESGALGCCPVFRLKNKTECVVEVDYWSVQYNKGLQSMLKEWQSKNEGIIYSYFDTYSAMSILIQSPASYGFTEVKGACCGLGELNARAPCLPMSNLCPNGQDHVFWDQFHPTEAASRIFVDKIFYGSSTYTSPINMRQLVAA
ncbi:GDSL esterase/lipase [Trifolium pratense]|uniref:GDSL esterase/lipase n=1 Tax=Trifolium pratense TaxID=57577 RepID=A0A2K3N9Y0_TRIPR|nr:GDSL esterase/lipase [Trifolium pratense]